MANFFNNFKLILKQNLEHQQTNYLYKQHKQLITYFNLVENLKDNKIYSFGLQVSSTINIMFL